MIKHINVCDEPGTIEVRKLQYGTIVSGLPSHPDSIYIKIDKRKTGHGLNLNFPDKHSVLLNIKTGALRAIPGDSRVRVYTGELAITRVETFQDFIKLGGC